MTDRPAARVMLALRAHHLIDLGLHQLVQHPEPDTDAAPAKPSLAAPASSPSASNTDGATPSMLSRLAATDAADTVLMAVGSPCPRTWFAPVTLPTGADEARGPPPSSSTSYGTSSDDLSWRESRIC